MNVKPITYILLFSSCPDCVPENFFCKLCAVFCFVLFYFTTDYPQRALKMRGKYFSFTNIKRFGFYTFVGR